MKFLSIVLLSLLAQPSAWAISYEIIGACDERPVYQGTQSAAGVSVGEATLKILKKNSIPHRGTEAAIFSILNTPEGDAAIEVLSDTEMRAYGWCYEVDGVQPSVMADQYRLKGSEHLKWFYGYALHKNGEWRTYCEPAHKVKPQSLCR
jgi:hypothetical protein